ncbi:flippase [Shewanella benthica]|uniref:Probable polysaccharide biosynthesis protein n=1 Tax=Shewanella benthica KT99 TaxID=314608 RepID=A9D4K3_9GAMM|nr:flippase [Shewanella benthica]EDQ01571.1 probable polysaccharide biosynthesis protein [Shewanella benthica KT99]
MEIIKKISKLKDSQGAMKYLKNTSWLLGEKILRMTVGLFIGIWVARYLGPEQFGLFSYAQSFVVLFSAFATLGLDGIVIRKLVKDESQRDKLLGTAFTLKLIGAFLVLALLVIAVFLQPSDLLANSLFFIIASATVFQSFNVIDFYFQSQVLSKYVVYSNVFSLLLSSIIKVTLIVNEAPLIAFAYVILFDSFVLASGFIYFYVLKRLSIRHWCFDKAVAKSLLKESWPLILSGLVVSMYMKIDQVMIKEMLGSVEVGQYSAAVRLSEAWYFIPMVISSSLFPAILNAKKISKELYYSRIQQLYDLMAWMAIAIAIPMTFLSDWLVHLLYGAQYNEAGGVLMIHIWSAVFVFLGVASGKWFVAEGLQIYSFYRTLAGAILNVGLNLVLIPQYGIYGAAIATLASQLVASYLFNVVNKKSRITFILQSKALLLPFRKIAFKY